MKLWFGFRAMILALVIPCWMLVCPAASVRGLEKGSPAPSSLVVEGEDPLQPSGESLSWARSVVPAGSSRARLAALNLRLVQRGWEAEDDLTISAEEAFDRGQGNCVSFALLLAGLARSQGIPAIFVVRGSIGSDLFDDLEIARAHLAVGLESRGRLLVFDASGAHQSEHAEYREISDEQTLGIFHSNQGAALLMAGQADLAAAALRRATATAPDLAFAWANLGVALRRLDAMSEAEAAYRRAILLAPDSASAWRNLALLLEERVRRER